MGSWGSVRIPPLLQNNEPSNPHQVIHFAKKGFGHKLLSFLFRCAHKKQSTRESYRFCTPFAF